jgi:nucleotide-binding universal stress UspA family protein
MTLLERVVVPVADESDAVATATALTPYLDEMRHVTMVHVIEKGGGAVDKAPMEKRRADTMEALSTVESRLEGDVTVATRVAFGTSVAETILEIAIDTGARALVFRPREANRLVRFLSGDTAIRLVTAAEVPIVTVTAESPPQTRSKGRPRGDRTEAT